MAIKEASNAGIAYPNGKVKVSENLSFFPQRTPIAELNGSVPPAIASEIVRKNSSGTLIPGDFPLGSLSIPEVKHYGKITDNLPADSVRLDTLFQYGGDTHVREMFATAGGTVRQANTKRVAGVDFKNDRSTLTAVGGIVNVLQVTRRYGKGFAMQTLHNPAILEITQPNGNGKPTVLERSFIAISAPTVKESEGKDVGREVTVVAVNQGKIDVFSLETATSNLHGQSEQTLVAIAEQLGERRVPVLKVEPPQSEKREPHARVRDISSAMLLHVDAETIKEGVDGMLAKVTKEEAEKAKQKRALSADFFANIRAARRIRQSTSE